MIARYAILGLLLGALAGGMGSYVLTGAIAGAVIGFLMGRIQLLEDRITQLSANIRILKGRKKPAPEAPVPAPGPEEAESVVSEAMDISERGGFAGTEPAITPGQAASQPAASTPAEPVWPEAPAGPGASGLLWEKARHWITTGNVPVKVGVIISFIGVSFLLKYAIDRKILALSLEMRLVAVALAGAVMLAIGWRLRQRVRVYALSLQGGGVGILFLTTFAALRLWQMLSPTAAFACLVALALLTAWLAVMQNARVLAVLGIVGGFLAPLLASTGQGSHVILFSYYLVLNTAVLAIAWFRSWRELNLLGFVFTFVISILWGYQYFKPALFSSTEPFLLLHFLFYQLIAVLYALRQPPERIGLVDGTLVFGTPVIVFALQAQMLGNTEYGLSITAAGAASFYGLLAAWLRRKQDTSRYLGLLTESFAALAVAFATIAVPLALDARWTSAAWALEGAALVWTGCRQKRHLNNLAGVGLILASGCAFLFAGWHTDAGFPVVNRNVLGGMMVAVSALFASRALEAGASSRFSRSYRVAAQAVFAWGVLWWLGTAWLETYDRLESTHQVSIFTLFTGVSAIAAAWVGRVRRWSRMQTATWAFLPLAVFLALQHIAWNEHLLVQAGWLAWPAAALAQFLVLYELDRKDDKNAAAWHLMTLLALTALIVFEVSWWIGQAASDAWARAASATTAGLLATLVWSVRKKPAWPVPFHPDSYLAGSLVLVAGQVAGLTLLNLLDAGDASPFSYVPVVNPYDLAMLFAFYTAWRSVAMARENPPLEFTAYQVFLAAAFLVLTSASLVRALHHYLALSWNYDALFHSVVIQTALSIWWGLLGFAAMILGARRSHRAVWIAGAGLMAVVVLKLFAVDLGNTGTVERIVSFIGTGLLLLVVGYFAPAPPREKDSR